MNDLQRHIKDFHKESLDRITEASKKREPSTAAELIFDAAPKVKSSKPISSLTSQDIDNLDKTDRIISRSQYADRLFWLLTGEIVGVFVLIFSVGAEWIELDEKTLGFLSSSVLLQTFGLVVIVVRSLFNSNGNGKPKKQK